MYSVQPVTPEMFGQPGNGTEGEMRRHSRPRLRAECVNIWCSLAVSRVLISP